MKCINCIYFPCIRLECEPNSNCDYYKSIVTAEKESIDNRAFIDLTNISYNPKKY